MKSDDLSPEQAWQEFLAILSTDPDRMRKSQCDPDDALVSFESFKYLMIGLCHGINMTMFADPDFPVWLPGPHYPIGYAGPNPDATYYYTQVNPAGVYRLWGKRNSVRVASTQVSSDWFGVSYLQELPFEVQENRLGNPRPLASYDFDEHIVCDADGAFEIMLSKTRPHGWSGNWWQLAPNACTLLTRFFAYDIEHEVDPEIHIERLDGPARPSRAAGYRYGNAVKSVAHVAVEMLGFFAEQLAKQRREMGINQFKITTFGGVGFSSQAYLQAPFTMADDEVLIVETEVPKTCHYWNFQLSDELFALFDYVNVQNSLNGFTAHIDSDGRFRAVVSSRDPGVHNWLDAGGLLNGVVLGRWTRADSHPVPLIRRVKFEELRAELPASTRYVTPQERRAELKKRRNSYLKRLRM